MNTVLRLLLSSTAVLALSACGNKGPLVLPEKPAPVEAPASTKPADDGTPPVQIQPQDSSSAPTPADDAADDAVDQDSSGSNG